MPAVIGYSCGKYCFHFSNVSCWPHLVSTQIPGLPALTFLLLWYNKLCDPPRLAHGDYPLMQLVHSVSQPPEQHLVVVGPQ